MYAAKVLAVGDEKAVKRAEDFLKSMDGSGQSDKDNQSPKKKRRWIRSRNQVVRLDKR